MRASTFLAERAAQLGYVGEEWEAEFRAFLRSELDKRGVKVSRQGAYQWLNGSNNPAPETLPVMCDVLRLDARGAADLYAACGIPLPETLQPQQGAA